jgi:23S rRNA pseudouridine1911/1915/1917 synthase
MSEVRHFIVDPAGAGQRLDTFLARASGLSRARVQDLIGRADVLVDGRPQKPRHAVRAGERVTLVVPDPEPLAIVPESIPLEILYEDEHLLVLNKPAGLVVHPGAGRTTGTLVHALLAHCRDLSGIGGVERPGIVHRLDRETSGVMVIAKSETAHGSLSGQFQDRIVRKRYLALVHGVMRGDAGRIEVAIGRRERDRTRMGVRERGGREARTAYRVLRRFADMTLVEASLETGRTHQIRVHLAHIGHPVLGDATYGGRRERRPAAPARPRPERHMLHAWRLGFRHPATNAWLEFTAPVPEDFRALAGTDLSGASVAGADEGSNGVVRVGRSGASA